MLHCNGYKGPNVAGIDAASGQVVPLFNPRREIWHEHFGLVEDGIVAAKTTTARVTIDVLRMNHPEAVAVRVCLLREGVMTATPNE